MKRWIASRHIEISQNFAVRFIERAVGPKTGCETMLWAKRLKRNEGRSKLDGRSGIKCLIGGLGGYGLSVESFYQNALEAIQRVEFFGSCLRLLRWGYGGLKELSPGD
jgi:hypothetical protein